VRCRKGTWEFEHLAGHGVLDTVDPRYAVANGDDAPHLCHIHIGGKAADLLADDLGYLDGLPGHSAHAWTPWFSIFGANSGFDSIEECFGEFSSHIHAVETGLSSDPEMNWRLSALDPITLISNSDAHSPNRLGREANAFDCPLDYKEIVETIRRKDRRKLLFTIEFFPEEGKKKNSEKFINQNFLGYSFLHSAFTADYEHPERKFRLFVIEGADANDCSDMIQRYLQQSHRWCAIRCRDRVRCSDRIIGIGGNRWRVRAVAQHRPRQNGRDPPLHPRGGKGAT
jgi:hypothetical protein